MNENTVFNEERYSKPKEPTNFGEEVHKLMTKFMDLNVKPRFCVPTVFDYAYYSKLVTKPIMIADIKYALVGSYAAYLKEMANSWFTDETKKPYVDPLFKMSTIPDESSMKEDFFARQEERISVLLNPPGSLAKMLDAEMLRANGY